MLEQTFVHIQGIGLKTEQSIWKRGSRTWHDFLNRQRPLFSKERDTWIEGELRTSLENRANIRFFSKRLPRSEMWRIYPAFASRTVFLDIETNGDYGGMNEITLIGLYDGLNIQTFINGRNLRDFEIAIAAYDLMITFNGSSFDLPIIKRFFPSIRLPAGHIDLRFALRRLGIKGGLKSIEKQLGIVRKPGIVELNGMDAVWLWRDHQAGDPTALPRLIEYNTADIVDLKPLMEYAYRELEKNLLATMA